MTKEGKKKSENESNNKNNGKLKPKNDSTALAICKNPFFLLLSFANFFAEWGLFVPLTYLPDAAVVKGNISMDDANYLMSAFGKYSLINMRQL